MADITVPTWVIALYIIVLAYVWLTSCSCDYGYMSGFLLPFRQQSSYLAAPIAFTQQQPANTQKYGVGTALNHAVNQQKPILKAATGAGSWKA